MAVSRRLTTIAEYALDKNLRPEELAGFRAWLGGTRCAADDDWDDLYNQYISRELGKNNGRRGTA